MKLKNMVILTFVFLLVVSAVSAFDVDTVKIEGVDMDLEEQDSRVQIELGEDTTVKVYFTATQSSDYVKVKAWLGGYEYGDIEDTSSIFDVEDGVTYSRTLTLEIPEDLDVDDNEFTLYVDVYDDTDAVIYAFDVYVEQQRHSLDIMDVIYGTPLETGDLVEVRLENLGESKEEDIKVELTLGDYYSRVYMDELAASPEDSNEDEEDSDSVSFILDLEGMEEGYYTMDVEVSYNRGYDLVTESYMVYVDGEEAVEVVEETTEEGEVLVSVSKDSEYEYTIEFVNTKVTGEVFMIDVLGVQQWADADVDSTVVISPGSEEVMLTLAPQDCAEGENEFTVQILDADGALFAEFTDSVEIEEKGWDWLKVLGLALIVLIVLVVLILIITRMSGSDDDDDDLELKDGKTYY